MSLSRRRSGNRLGAIVAAAVALTSAAGVAVADDSAAVRAPRGGPPGVCAPVECAAMVVGGPIGRLRAEVAAAAARSGRSQLEVLLERVHVASIAQVRALALDPSATPTAFIAILDRHDAVRAMLLAQSSV